MPQQSLLTRGIKFTPLLIILWATVWVVAPRWGAATIKRPRSTYDVRWQVVGGARTTHRFFDSSAISPSGRYVCATRTRREGPADVVLLDAQVCERAPAGEVGAPPPPAAPAQPAAASEISRFISATASRIPRNRARLTMECPMCSSETPGSAAIPPTFA